MQFRMITVKNRQKAVLRKCGFIISKFLTPDSTCRAGKAVSFHKNIQSLRILRIFFNQLEMVAVFYTGFY